MQTKSVQVCAAVLISLAVAGCSNKDRVIPQPDMTMQEVYEQHNGKLSSGKINESRITLRRSLNQHETDLSPYVRSEANHLESKFQMLPNPTLYMFVAPHLSTKDRVPVPGYLTEFKLYERDEYALPGEVAN